MLAPVAPAQAHKWDTRAGVERTVWKVGQKEKAPGRHRITAYMACLQESRCNRNVRGDYGLAVGIFQMHPHWGSYAQRRNVNYASHWFYGQARKADRGQSLNDLAQAVERSARPYAYAKWEPEARRIVARQKRKDRRVRKRRRARRQRR